MATSSENRFRVQDFYPEDITLDREIMENFAEFLGHSDHSLDSSMESIQENLLQQLNESEYLNSVFSDAVDASLDEPLPRNPLRKDIVNDLSTSKLDENLLGKYETCSICTCNFSLDEDIIILPCIHAYHEKCIKVWFKEQNTCPICRKQPFEEPQKKNETENNLTETLNLSEETENNLTERSNLSQEVENFLMGALDLPEESNESFTCSLYDGDDDNDDDISDSNSSHRPNIDCSDTDWETEDSGYWDSDFEENEFIENKL